MKKKVLHTCTCTCTYKSVYLLLMILTDSIYLYAIDDETPPKTDLLKPRESKSQPPAIMVSITLVLVTYLHNMKYLKLM